MSRPVDYYNQPHKADEDILYAQYVLGEISEQYPDRYYATIERAYGSFWPAFQEWFKEYDPGVLEPTAKLSFYTPDNSYLFVVWVLREHPDHLAHVIKQMKEAGW